MKTGQTAFKNAIQGARGLDKYYEDRTSSRHPSYLERLVQFKRLDTTLVYVGMAFKLKIMLQSINRC
jgi:hypothetical protein